jgi:hypothetical protein
MIQNIIDRRKRNYRWARVDVVVEPTWHDNTCRDSDQAVRDDREPVYDAQSGVSLADAIDWAQALPLPMTLYIYDDGANSVAVPWPDNKSSN